MPIDTFFTRFGFILECMGCQDISFIKQEHHSESFDYTSNEFGEVERIPIYSVDLTFPTPNYFSRAWKPWFEDIEDSVLISLLKEVYWAINSSNLFLASFGSRTIIDRIMVLKETNHNTFEQGLNDLVKRQTISDDEAKLLRQLSMQEMLPLTEHGTLT